MEKDSPVTHSIPELAAALGITDRHLRRVFLAEYGVSPVQYLQTQRLLLAKSLLTDTRLSVIDAAMAAGFGSIRRFNDLFQKHYHLAPNELRNNARGSGDGHDGITLLLGYRPPYDWNVLISFLAYRAIPGVESVVDGVYRRTVVVEKAQTIHHGWISVANQPERNALSVTVAATLLPVLPEVLTRVRFLFDANCSPEKVREKLETMNHVTPNICVPGIRVPGCFDPFEMSVRAILGQQVTVKAANTLAMRLVNTFGSRVETPFEELASVFPHPDRMRLLEGKIENHLGPLGITGAKARSILAVAVALSSRSVTLSYGANPEDEMEKLRKLPGFGPWTVQYVAMRALGWPDAFPHTDYGVKKALPGRSPQEILELSRAWSPWRSYATILLWNSLSNNSQPEKERYGAK
jgi:AraC family transcriptional regulator of adaptative response / DNA-3-methyladenine glycosylase II